ncbi:MAG: hypothetical protein HY717_02510 [Planctomycetes bacterium]|nr:hypothetical protein [Planctomycetota bacterium]
MLIPLTAKINRGGARTRGDAFSKMARALLKYVEKQPQGLSLITVDFL